MFTLFKYERSGHANLRERLVIKGFKTEEALDKFLDTNYNFQQWKSTKGKIDLCRESIEGLKPGTYVRAGGKLHNIKSLDPSVLAHC